MVVMVLVVVIAGLALVVGSDLHKGPRGGPGLTSRRTIYGRARQELDDARGEAAAWVDRLDDGVLSLGNGGSDATARQALADADERLGVARSELGTADSIAQFVLVRQSAVEGLQYVRAGRAALGLEPGPELLGLSAGRPM